MKQTRLLRNSDRDTSSFDINSVDRQKRWLLYLSFLLLFSSLISSCSDIEPSDFYEVDGLVSGAINDSLSNDSWKPVNFINSSGLQYTTADSSVSQSLNFSVFISNPGSYSFWLLAAFPGTEHSDSVAVVDISITGPDNFLHSRSSLQIPHEQRLLWRSVDIQSDSEMISFDEPGQYRFSINPREPVQVQIHKFQISFNDVRKPFGLGLVSSTRTDLSAADLFREIPVMLPPHWVFKPVIGFEQDDSIPVQSNSYYSDLLARNKVGAYWLKNDSIDSSNVNMHNSDKNLPSIGLGISSLGGSCVDDAEYFYDSGYQFFITDSSPGLECLQKVHQEYQDYAGDDYRSVFFHGVADASNFDMRQYPAPVMPSYEFEWTSPRSMAEGEYMPGGYRELVGDISNPTVSVYNMPFLSLPIKYPSNREEWDSELFIRTVQLSPFLPVMHLLLPNENSSLNDDELGQLEASINLRNSLFPYTYSHAHYTRQSNMSVITGSRQYSGQFLYGEAFLVAPVVDPNSDGRLIYFPEGRVWYDYYSGEEFQAGQSWFYETESDKLPLFVKAGSVIPLKKTEDANHLTVEIYTGDAGAFRLVEDDGLTREYRRADAARTMFRYNEIQGNLKLTIGAVQAGFDGMSDEKSYDIYFKKTDKPERIELNEEELSEITTPADSDGWRYDQETESIIVSLNNRLRYEKMDIVVYP